MEIERLQFITRNLGRSGILSEVGQFLSGGGRWVQLRMKGASETDAVETGLAVRELCDAFGAVFLMNDSIRLAALTHADGVHLGKGDGTAAEARQVLGPGKIVGRTAHTAEDILGYAAEGADYVGLGALRETATKENIAGVLGYGGYREIYERLEGASFPPVVAIGGVTEEDVPVLRGIGLYGVAVSGRIGRAARPAEMARRFLALLKND